MLEVPVIPIAAAIVVLSPLRLFRVYGRHAAILRESATRQRVEAYNAFVPARRRFSPTLAVMWGLFVACIGILAAQDLAYALALLVTAASSCKLRRVCHGTSGKRGSVQIAG